VDARRHFDRVATGYRARFSAGPLGWVRRRERAALLSLLDPRPADHILDAGCGSGFDAVPLRERGCQVVGVDLSPNMVAEARRVGVDAHVADLHELDLGRRFDKILCAGPLEFCADPDRVLERLAAHLSPQGRLVVLFPRPSAAGVAYHLYHRTHGLSVELFTLRAMRRKLADAGLQPGRALRPTPFTGVVEARAP
jgi:SAM-dependent methyltransferase